MTVMTTPVAASVTAAFEDSMLAAEMEVGCAMASSRGSDYSRGLAARVNGGEITLDEARADIVARFELR